MVNLTKDGDDGDNDEPFVVETCGGMGPAVVKLLKVMARAAQ